MSAVMAELVQGEHESRAGQGLTGERCLDGRVEDGDQLLADARHVDVPGAGRGGGGGGGDGGGDYATGTQAAIKGRLGEGARW